MEVIQWKGSNIFLLFYKIMGCVRRKTIIIAKHQLIYVIIFLGLFSITHTHTHIVIIPIAPLKINMLRKKNWSISHPSISLSRLKTQFEHIFLTTHTHIQEKFDFFFLADMCAGVWLIYNVMGIYVFNIYTVYYYHNYYYDYTTCQYIIVFLYAIHRIWYIYPSLYRDSSAAIFCLQSIILLMNMVSYKSITNLALTRTLHVMPLGISLKFKSSLHTHVLALKPILHMSSAH